MVLQEKYCNDNNVPKFAPIEDGKCWSCHQQVTDNGKSLITGCDKCNRTFCD